MIRFYNKRIIFFSISIALFVIGMIFLFVNGLNIDIQFRGGAILRYSFVGGIEADDVAADIEKALGKAVSTQVTRDLMSAKTTLVFSFAAEDNISTDEQDLIENVLTEKYPHNDFVLSQSNSVEPFIGKRQLRNGLIAIIIASILIVFYVWIRFKKISGLSAGVMALVALAHDCLMVFFTYAIFRIPINESFIAVILTIIGYSINDTIIIYDRIRENYSNKELHTIEDLVDKSITQSMTRSINTATTTIMSIAVMMIFAYIYGITSILWFTLPMLVGMFSGCYSTICIAGPLWVMWQKYKQKRKLKKKAIQ